MQYLQEINGGFQLAKETSKQLAEFERGIKALKQKQDEIKQAILEEMETNGIIKIETEDLTVNYVRTSSREAFDLKRFKEQEPDMYDRYIDIKMVKPSIRVKVKEVE